SAISAASLPAASAQSQSAAQITFVPGSGSVIIEAAKKNKLGAGITVVIVLAVLLAASSAIFSLTQKPPHLPYEHFSIENLSNNGHIMFVSISPDGKYLALVWEENGLQALGLRHIQIGSNTQIVAPVAIRYFGLTFSSDGSYLY